MTTVAKLQTETLTVFVPMTAGVILGSTHRNPWLARNVAEALGRLDEMWQGQPVFRYPEDADAWIGYVTDLNPRLGPWTVAERQARIQPMTDGSVRLHLQ